MFNSLSEAIVWLVIGWAIWPGSFFLVALLGESRLPPIWKHQSRAFFPGDLALPVIWIAILRINLSENMLIGPLALIISISATLVVDVIAILIVTIVAKKDRVNYPDRSLKSPTKFYHDLMGYYLFPLSTLPHCVFYVTSHVANHVSVSWSLLWVVVPLMFYILCVVSDIRKGFTMEDIQKRHPEDWKPVWRTNTFHKIIQTVKQEPLFWVIAAIAVIACIGMIITAIPHHP